MGDKSYGGDYWKNDIKLVQELVDFFRAHRKVPLIWDKSSPFEFEIGGKTWHFKQGHTGATGPYDGRIVLCQKDGTRDPEITINIKVRPSNKTKDGHPWLDP